MRMNPLGQTGLLVSELCLGTMTFGGSGTGQWGAIGQLGDTEGEALVAAAIEAGINFIDTANVYSEGRSEEITGRALRSLKIPRDDVVVATKVFARMGPGPNAAGASRGHILAACKASLKRLGLDHIDLYQLHGFDPATPIDEMLEALDTLVRHGHVRYVGLSNWAAWQVTKALGIAERKHLAMPRSLQAYYTLAGRDLEREIVPMLTSEKVGLMVWSPLAGGLLSGKYDLDEAPETAAASGGASAPARISGPGIGQGLTDTSQGGGRRVTFDFPPVDRPRARNAVAALRAVAEAKGATPAQVALAWLLHQPVVTAIIVGAKRPDQLAENIAAAAIVLTPDDLATLDEATRLPAEYPGWMIERQARNRPKQGPRGR